MPIEVETRACESCGRNRTRGNYYELNTGVYVCSDRNVCIVTCDWCGAAHPAGSDYVIKVDGQRRCVHCTNSALKEANGTCACGNKTKEYFAIIDASEKEVYRCKSCKDTGVLSLCCERLFLAGLVQENGMCVMHARDYWMCAVEHSPKPARKGSNCEDCYRDEEGNLALCRCGLGTTAKPVHNYSCKPALEFWGESPENLHFGFELETQIKNNLGSAALFARDSLQIPRVAILKEDASIGSGFEIVTMPATYEHYRDRSGILWDTINKLRTDWGARSWDAGTCGFHIHVARKGFSDSDHMHRFIAFIYRNAEMMMKFAGRKNTYALWSSTWAIDEYEQPFFTVSHRLGVGGEKMYAVNTRHAETLELRFFRGTMNVEGAMAYLGLAHAMVQYTRELEITSRKHVMTNSDSQAEVIEFDYSWESFAKYVTEHRDIYPELEDRMPKIKSIVLKDMENLKIDA